MSGMKGIEKRFYVSSACFLPSVIAMLLLPLSGTGENTGQVSYWQQQWMRFLF